jgi:hypothetical protein
VLGYDSEDTQDKRRGSDKGKVVGPIDKLAEQIGLVDALDMKVN